MRLRKPLHLICVLSAVLSGAAVFSGCTSVPGAAGPSGSRAPVHRSLYKVDTTFGDSVQGKTYTFVRNAPYDGPEYNSEFRVLEQFLELEGMKQVQGTQMKPDFQITYHTAREAPPTGISVGVILPYTHTVRLTARRGGLIDWQIRVIGTSEEKNIRHSLFRLLGAARHFFGQSTGGEQRLHLADDDVKMLEIQGTAPAPSPSPSLNLEG